MEFSNKTFWSILRATVRKIIPHQSNETYEAYVMLLRLTQAIFFSSDCQLMTEQLLNDHKEPHLDYWDITLLDKVTRRTTVAGIEYELEVLSPHDSLSIETTVWRLTSEEWEAKIHFADYVDEYGDLPWFLRQTITVDELEIAGDVPTFLTDMLLASLVISDLEYYDAFYDGHPR